jgi:hypothetical protein
VGARPSPPLHLRHAVPLRSALCFRLLVPHRSSVSLPLACAMPVARLFGGGCAELWPAVGGVPASGGRTSAAFPPSCGKLLVSCCLRPPLPSVPSHGFFLRFCFLFEVLLVSVRGDGHGRGGCAVDLAQGVLVSWRGTLCDDLGFGRFGCLLVLRNFSSLEIQLVVLGIWDLICLV